MKKLVRVSSVEPLEDYKCRLVFEDNTQKTVDLEPYLRGPVFKPLLQDINEFRRVKVVEGVISWENGADIDPDVLYHDLKPAWIDEKIPE